MSKHTSSGGSSQLPAKKLGSALPLVLMLGVGGAAFAIYSINASAQERQQTQKEMAELRKKLARVEAASTDTQSAAQSLILSRLADINAGADVDEEPSYAAPAVPSAAEHELPEPSVEGSEEEQEQRSMARMQQKLDAYATTLATEARDVAWANEANARIAEAYTTDAIPGIRFSSECASTLCKISYSYTEERDKMATYQHFMEATWAGQRFCFLDAPTKQGTCYVSRQEHSLPSAAGG